MGPRRINKLMFFLSCIGGLIGYVIGEILLKRVHGTIPNALLIGLYFGQLALITGIMCLTAENIKPVLNGENWRLRYSRTSWLMLVPFTLLLLFISGMVFQFIYEFNIGKVKNADDIVMVIDSSGSMAETDPDNQRLQAAQMLVGKMTSQNRVAVIAFNENAAIVQDMTPVADSAAKDEICTKIGQNNAGGGTNIDNALNLTIQHIRETAQAGRGSVVILLSDGVSEINLMNAVDPYRDERIPIFTVGMMIEDLYGTQLLNNIADETGGSYTNVSNVQDLKNILQNIYVNKDKRLLVDKRYGLTHSSILYAFLRILFIMLIGIFIGAALGLIFDNRNLVKGFAIGGAVSGLIAGIILETGFAAAPAFGSVYRAIADVLLAAVFTLFSAAVSLNDNSQKDKPGYPGNTGLSRSKGFNNDRNTGSKSF